ncbi:hypothetical protein ABTZ03_37005, partial [Kitasatospora sp. NPDC096077]
HAGDLRGSPDREDHRHASRHGVDHLPNTFSVVHDGPHLDADRTFQSGLDFLLDGIAARIPN